MTPNHDAANPGGASWLRPVRRVAALGALGILRTLLPFALVAAPLMLAGCTFARYAKLQVQVVDQESKEGVPRARLRTFYVKPMWDMTYQRKDHERTDREGFATLTIATNWSQ